MVGSYADGREGLVCRREVGRSICVTYMEVVCNYDYIPFGGGRATRTLQMHSQQISFIRKYLLMTALHIIITGLKKLGALSLSYIFIGV